jgi:hypothetical protein
MTVRVPMGGDVEVGDDLPVKAERAAAEVLGHALVGQHSGEPTAHRRDEPFLVVAHVKVNPFLHVVVITSFGTVRRCEAARRLPARADR